MARFVVRRLAYLVLVCIAASMMVFILVRASCVLPGISRHNNREPHIGRESRQRADAVPHVLPAARIGPIPEPAVDYNMHKPPLPI